jgi:hypothetical protein
MEPQVLTKVTDGSAETFLGSILGHLKLFALGGLHGEAHRACVAHVMYKVDWARGEVSPHSGFTVKTSPEAAATPSEARGAPHLRSLIVIRRDFPIFRQEAQIGE